MRVFVGYGYHPRDSWIEEFVFPLVTAFGIEVVHGKAVYGGALPDEVMKNIRLSDAMIGFTTQRDDLGGGKFSTHPWVVQELTVAEAQVPRIPWVEVREDGVDIGGLLEAADLQRIDYKETERAMCLVKIAQALRRFRELTNVTTIRLGPGEAVDQISPLLDDPTFACTCQILRGIIETPAVRKPVLPIKGGLYVQLQGVASNELVRLTITAGGRTWRSAYESIDTVDLQLKERT